MAVEGINRELFEKWVNALEEDDRQQTTGSLEVVTDGQVSQCCKGVLCEVAGPELAGPRVVTRYGNVSYNTNMAAPPYAVVNALFGGDSDLQDRHTNGASGDDVILLDADDPKNPNRDSDSMDGQPFTAIQANDDHGWPFKRIAAAIRARYLD